MSGMVLSFLESIKYVGHLWPVALMRLFVGVQYFRMATAHLSEGFLKHPYFSEQVRLKAESGADLNIYISFCSEISQEYWLLMSYILIVTEFAIAISYLLGYLVRPIALWAAFLSLHLYFLIETSGGQSQFLFFSIHLMLCLISAGRCLGLDYYFYKRRRGLLW